MGRLIEDIALGRRRVHIVNMPNNGAIPNLPDHAIMEIEGVTDSCGVRGVYMGEAPLYLKGFLEKRIAWQELVVDAAVNGDRNLALQALLLDEMAIMPEKAEAMLDELLAASKDLLPQFEDGPGIDHDRDTLGDAHGGPVAADRVQRPAKAEFVGKGVVNGGQIVVQPAVAHDPHNVARMRVGEGARVVSAGDVGERLDQRAVGTGCRGRLVDQDGLPRNQDPQGV